MRTSNDFTDRYDGDRAFPAVDVRRRCDAFAAACVPDAMATHMPGLRHRTLQIGCASICKPRIGRSSERPSSIAS
ncbi:hypothetical protein VL15_15420 [Burkholderia cepacia]|uniref:Uncharacterized protein n=1 Tax=Burkholderia cepacia TaxID=292 RepID=A0A0J5WX16_BURCE|nr:hypothetical protein VL15_15420 [Burkholderia cepacia]